MSSEIHICTAADNNYIVPLSALITSICKNSGSDKVWLHIMYTGISIKYQHMLHKLCKGTNLSLDFKNMDEFVFDFPKIDMQHWTKAIFYRMLIPVVFKELDRILYIDGDTLILQNLHELFFMDLQEDKILAMVIDKFSYKNRKKQLETSNYFNSGVILFNLCACRQFDFSNRCIRWLVGNQDKAIYPDQDAINKICDGKILRISNLYNNQQAPQDDFKIDISINSPVIIHFLSAIKPWMKTSSKQFGKMYLAYIPYTRYRLCILLQQCWHRFKKCLFYQKRDFKMINGMVQEFVRFYVLNRNIYTKKINKKDVDLISFLKQKAKEHAASTNAI